MKNTLFVLLITLSISAFSQEILLKQDVKADTVRPSFGPNLKNYLHGYLGLGFPFFTNEAVKYTKPGLSIDINGGIRYKRKITNYVAVGLDLGLYLDAYKLKQSKEKVVPDTVSNDKEKLQFSSVSSSAFVRINVGRRGNYMGNYLDLGAYGSWNYIKKHKAVNENAEGEKVKVLTSRLHYIEDFSYGFLSRLGNGRYALTAHYRISDLFKARYSMPELPRLMIGFEFGLFK